MIQTYNTDPAVAVKAVSRGIARQHYLLRYTILIKCDSVSLTIVCT